MKSLVYVSLCSVFVFASLAGCAPTATPTVGPTSTPVLPDAVLTHIGAGGRVTKMDGDEHVELEIDEVLFNGDLIRAHGATARLDCLKTGETLKVPADEDYTVRCAMRALSTSDPCSSDVASQIPGFFSPKGIPIEPPACLEHPKNLPFIIEALGYDQQFYPRVLANANFSYGLFYLGEADLEEASFSLWEAYDLFQGLGLVEDAYQVKAFIDEYNLSRLY